MPYGSALGFTRNRDHPMTLDLSTVAIVLDAGFGMRLRELAARMPVWIVDTPDNRAAIESEWTRRRRDGAEREVTVFRMIEGLSPAEHIAALARTVDRHHGPSAQSPPFEMLVVIGAAVDAVATAALASIGGEAPVPTDDGFTVQFRR
jgi:hypothetical protein